MTTVHDSPDYKIIITKPPPEGYPDKSTPDSFSDHPFQPDFEARRHAFLENCLRNPSPTNTKAAYYELARLSAGGLPHEGVIHAVLDYIDQRKDCADFAIHSILRLLYQFKEDPRLSNSLVTRAQHTVLNFKYWPDEPGIDDLCTWTENHQILFASAAYLAGQLYPNETFINSGHTGKDKIAMNYHRIKRWLDLRFSTGFSEWLSHVYYDEDMTAILSLVDFCVDDEIVQCSKMVLDIMLLDMALNSYQGVFGCSHGRSYENTKKWSSTESTTDTGKLIFGMGIFSAFDNMSAINFALSKKYCFPPVLEKIANDLQHREMINRQRMGIRLVEIERWGLGFDDFEDGMVFLSLEAYTHPRTINLFMRMMDKYNWWENNFLSPFKPYRRFLNGLHKIGLLPTLTHLLEYDVCRNTREEVNLYTYRTPDYMLSTAQDYRPGYGGDQQHIWQATLGPNAVCFTTHPSTRGGGTPDYWAGSGTLPRAAQTKNVVIVIYKITRRPALYVPNRYFFTHAWLPCDQFDEVVEQKGWIFVRKADGYLALHSQHQYHWQTQPGEDHNREVIVEGAENIWLCELGRRETDGEFDQFIDQICQAQLVFGRLKVTYQSPSQGLLEFGWREPFLQDGKQVAFQNYPRYDNAYSRALFPMDKILITCDQHTLELNWRNSVRRYGRGGKK